MKKLASWICASLFALPIVAGAEQVCKKKGEVIQVAGKDDKEKKADCESKGGAWEKKEKEKKKESTWDSGGGGW